MENPLEKENKYKPAFSLHKGNLNLLTKRSGRTLDTPSVQTTTNRPARTKSTAQPREKRSVPEFVQSGPVKDLYSVTLYNSEARVEDPYNESSIKGYVPLLTTTIHLDPGVFNKAFNKYLRSKLTGVAKNRILKGCVKCDPDNEFSLTGVENLIYLDGDFKFNVVADNNSNTNTTIATMYMDLWIQQLVYNLGMNEDDFVKLVFIGDRYKNPEKANKGGFHVYIAMKAGKFDQYREGKPDNWLQTTVLKIQSFLMSKLRPLFFDAEVFLEWNSIISEEQSHNFMAFADMISDFLAECGSETPEDQLRTMNKVFDVNTLYCKTATLMPFAVKVNKDDHKREKLDEKRIYRLKYHNYDVKEGIELVGSLKEVKPTNTVAIEEPWRNVTKTLDWSDFMEKVSAKGYHEFCKKHFSEKSAELFPDLGSPHPIVKKFGPLSKMLLKNFLRLPDILHKDNQIWAQLDANRGYIDIYCRLFDLIFTENCLLATGGFGINFFPFMGIQTNTDYPGLTIQEIVYVLIYAIRGFLTKTAPVTKVDADRMEAEKVTYNLLSYMATSHGSKSNAFLDVIKAYSDPSVRNKFIPPKYVDERHYEKIMNAPPEKVAAYDEMDIELNARDIEYIERRREANATFLANADMADVSAHVSLPPEPTKKKGKGDKEEESKEQEEFRMLSNALKYSFFNAVFKIGRFLMKMMECLTIDIWQTFECHPSKHRYTRYWSDLYCLFYIMTGINYKWNPHTAQTEFIKNITKHFVAKGKEDKVNTLMTPIYVYNMIQMEELYDFPYNQWILDTNGFIKTWSNHIFKTIMLPICTNQYEYYNNTRGIRCLIQKFFFKEINLDDAKKKLVKYFDINIMKDADVRKICDTIEYHAKKASSIQTPDFNMCKYIPVRNGLLTLDIDTSGSQGPVSEKGERSGVCVGLDMLTLTHKIRANVVKKFDFSDTSKHNFDVLLTRYNNVPFDEEEFQTYYKSTSPLYNYFRKIVIETKKIANNNMDDHRFLMYYLSYALHSYGSRDTILILHGSGSDGKTTLMNMVKIACGLQETSKLTYFERVPGTSIRSKGRRIKLINPATFVTSMASSVLTEKKTGSSSGHDENGRINLLESRLCVLEEVDSSKETCFNSAVIKELTGGGEIVARKIYRESVTFKVNSLMILVVNHIPKFSEVDIAMKRRMLCFNCTTKFVQENVLQQTSGNFQVDNKNSYHADTSFMDGFHSDINYRKTMFYYMLTYAVDSIHKYGTSLSGVKLSPHTRAATLKMFGDTTNKEEISQDLLTPVVEQPTALSLRAMMYSYLDNKNSEDDRRCNDAPLPDAKPQEDQLLWAFTDVQAGGSTEGNATQGNAAQGNTAQAGSCYRDTQLNIAHGFRTLADYEHAALRIVEGNNKMLSIKECVDVCMSRINKSEALSRQYRSQHEKLNLENNLYKQFADQYHFDLVYLSNEKFHADKVIEMKRGLNRDQSVIFDSIFKTVSRLAPEENIQEYRYDERAFSGLYIKNHNINLKQLEHVADKWQQTNATVNARGRAKANDGPKKTTTRKPKKAATEEE